MKTTLRINKFYAFVLTVLAFTSCSKDDDNTLQSTLSNDITNQNYVEILERNLTNLPNDAQIAIALVRGSNTEYLGVINQNNALRSTNNANKIFEVGSITKVLTGICLSSLVASNETSLSETLQDQFDYTLTVGSDITLQQLANHTSGLPVVPTNTDEVVGLDLEDPYAIYTPENLKSYLQDHISLNSPSGTQYEYSNLGMGILGYTLSRKRNTTYEQMLQQIILNPLGMNNTTTILDDVPSATLVEPRDINGNVVSHWNFAETMSGAGSIKSSVSDMAKFIQKNFEDDTVYNLAQMGTVDGINGLKIGLGWNVFEGQGYIIHTHDGGTGGFSSILMLDKQKEIGVIVLANVEGYEAISEICNDLIVEITD